MAGGLVIWQNDATQIGVDRLRHRSVLLIVSSSLLDLLPADLLVC